MYSRSAAFDTAYRYSHNPVCSVEILSQGNVVANASAIPLLGGEIQIDENAGIRRRGDIQVADEFGKLLPKTPGDVLSPYGTEARIYRDIEGVGDHIPVGTLRISKAQSIGGGKINLTLFDRARSVQRATFEVPYVIAEGTNFTTAIQTLIESRLSGLTFSFQSTNRTTPQIVLDQGLDPWAEAQKLAYDIGCELFFDPMGVCVMRTVVDPSGLTLDWDYSEGSVATILDASNELSDEPGYNGITVIGEPPGLPPVYAVAYDLDPASPTYALGPYGKVPRTYKSTFIATQQQADDTALSEMRRTLGNTEQVQFSAVPHSAHEGGDLVRVQVADRGIADNYVLASFNMPLSYDGAMTATCRKRRFQ